MKASAVQFAVPAGGAAPGDATHRCRTSGTGAAANDAHRHRDRGQPLHDLSEAKLARHIAQRLDRGLEQLPTGIQARLATAQAAALAMAHRVRTSPGSLSNRTRFEA